MRGRERQDQRISLLCLPPPPPFCDRGIVRYIRCVHQINYSEGVNQTILLCSDMRASKKALLMLECARGASMTPPCVVHVLTQPVYSTPPFDVPFGIIKRFELAPQWEDSAKTHKIWTYYCARMAAATIKTTIGNQHCMYH